MNQVTDRFALAKSIAWKGAVVGGALALLATVPSLISSEMKFTVVLTAIPILLEFLLLGAWFPTVCLLSKLDPGKDSEEAGTSKLSSTRRRNWNSGALTGTGIPPIPWTC